ncbi:MAG: hypothetical protein IT335_11535 [Thermomicrobiales bacterium]|nr:hypothetical protein [Thermomicrobiales bacterium]
MILHDRTQTSLFTAMIDVPIATLIAHQLQSISSGNRIGGQISTHIAGTDTFALPGQSRRSRLENTKTQ